MKALLGVLVFCLPLLAAAERVQPIKDVESFVNIRALPEAGTDIVGRLYQGDSLELIETVSGWHQVQIDKDTSGYISADWTTVSPDAGAVPAETDDVGGELAATSESRQIDSGEPLLEDGAADEAAAPEPVAEENTAAEAVASDAQPEEAAADLTDSQPEQVSDAHDAGATGADTVLVPVIAASSTPPPVTTGPTGPPGPAGPAGAATIKGTQDFLVKFRDEAVGGNSQIFDDGNFVGIGTTDPQQRLEVNGSIQINEQNSSVAGLMITQSSGDTGYILHNRASTLTIGAGSQDRLTIDRDGNVGFSTARPAHPIELASGAHVTKGGVWTNSSSRELKENIESLTVEQALAALAALEPVQYNYRSEADESYLGFIAEDVPELVASGDRRSLSPMDVVAVLTRVLQAQQARIEELESRLGVDPTTED